MAGKKRVIETGVDKLVKLVKDEGQISIKEAAKELGVSKSSVEEWADFLEEEGIISIQSKLANVYLRSRKIDPKQLKEKVKGVKEEKEQFLRRVESSINSLERDSKEIKLIDTEFKQIKGLIDQNFKKLSGKLGKLEDFRKSHNDIQSKKKDLEKEYEKRLEDMQKRLEKERHQYHDLLKEVSKELEKIKGEEDKIEQLKGREDKLQKKIEGIDKEIHEVQKEIKKENQDLDEDKKELKKTEENAKRVRNEIEKYSKEMDGLHKKLGVSRKELENMEKEFVEDLQALEKGKLEKIGAYKEAKGIVEQIKRFFDSSKEIEDLIHEAEKEEKELREHFQKMVKKATAFKVMAKDTDMEKDMEQMQKELIDIEERKDKLGQQLKRLRTIVRKVLK